MAITIRWQNDNRYIHSRFSDPWTLDDFLRARQTWHNLIDSVDHRVPILLDLRGSSCAPSGILTHFAAIHRTSHPRQGHIYILGISGDMARLKDQLPLGAPDPDKAVLFINSITDIKA